MKYLTAIKTINYFHQYEEYLIASGEKIAVYNANLQVIDSLDISPWYALLFDNYYIFQSENGQEVRYIDLNDIGFTSYSFDNDTKYYLFRNSIIDGNLLIENTLNEIVFFDAKLNKESSYTIGRYRLFLPQKHYLKVWLNNLSYNDIITNAELWRSEFTDNIQKIEVWEEKVVLIELVGQNENKIIALNAEKGTEVWQTQGAKLQIINNKIYGVRLNHSQLKIIEYNPLDVGNSKEYDLTKLIFEILGKTENFQYTIQDDIIYISITSRKTLLVIDLLSSQLIWRYDFAPSAQPRSHWIEEPKVSGNRIYVLDEEKTLHIFERDKTA